MGYRVILPQAYDVAFHGGDPYNEHETHGEFESVWLRIGEEGEKCGVAWGGRWPGRKADRPHLEMKGA